MRFKTLAGIVSVAFVLVMGACGDDNGEEDTATTAENTVSTNAESNSANDGAAAAESPKELAACVRKAGYNPTLIPPPAEGVPGAEFGSLGTVRIDVGKDNGVAAVFFEDAKQAEELDKNIGKEAISGTGTAEVIGAVYLSANEGEPAELETFRTCLGG